MKHEKPSGCCIDVKNLSVSFGDLIVVDNVSFAIKQNTIVAIIGPNGSGKSTLLKAMLGLVPYEGEVKIFDHKIEKVLDRVGYVPQRFKLEQNFPITVEEFLRLSGKFSDTRIHTVLKDVEMLKHRTRPMSKLSGGQMQRILIAHALLGKPDLLFMDEPTSGIDIDGVKDFYSLIRHMNKEHKVTIVLVSHEVNMVYKTADSILCLNKNLVCDGDPKVALTSKVLKKLYGEDVEIKHHTH